jgi:hypothetical protein
MRQYTDCQARLTGLLLSQFPDTLWNKQCLLRPTAPALLVPGSAKLSRKTLLGIVPHRAEQESPLFGKTQGDNLLRPPTNRDFANLLRNEPQLRIAAFSILRSRVNLEEVRYFRWDIPF